MRLSGTGRAIVFLAAMGVAPLVHGWPPAQQSRAPLTTARAAYDLTLAVARRAYPVRLRATVTYYDP